MPLVRPYHRYRGIESFTSDDLLAAAAEMLRTIAPVQTRYRVGAVPTARSLRFYTARGLVDKPLSARPGERARYGYRHLLQLLAVKFLQSQYLPLVKIRGLVAEAGNRDLEQLLPDVGAPPLRALVSPRPPVAREPAGDPEPPAPREPEDAWLRVEIGPGIELHVHHAALRAGERELLRGALLRELGRIRGWGGGARA